MVVLWGRRCFDGHKRRVVRRFGDVVRTRSRLMDLLATVSGTFARRVGRSTDGRALFARRPALKEVAVR